MSFEPVSRHHNFLPSCINNRRPHKAHECHREKCYRHCGSKTSYLANWYFWRRFQEIHLGSIGQLWSPSSCHVELPLSLGFIMDMVWEEMWGAQRLVWVRPSLAWLAPQRLEERRRWNLEICGRLVKTDDLHGTETAAPFLVGKWSRSHGYKDRDVFAGWRGSRRRKLAIHRARFGVSAETVAAAINFTLMTAAGGQLCVWVSWKDCIFLCFLGWVHYDGLGRWLEQYNPFADSSKCSISMRTCATSWSVNTQAIAYAAWSFLVVDWKMAVVVCKCRWSSKARKGIWGRGMLENRVGWSLKRVPSPSYSW